MATTTAGCPDPARPDPAKVPTAPSFFYRPEVRSVIYQTILLVALAALFGMAIYNATTNLEKQRITGGFGFLDRTSSFDISQHLIDYSSSSTFGRAIVVGLINTLIVSAIGIVLATIVGFTMGMARLSKNWLIARIAGAYVEVSRNVPLLLQLFIWYFGVVKNLPDVYRKDADGGFITGADGQRIPGSFELWGGALLNKRGLIMPEPQGMPGANYVLWTMLLGILASIAVAWWARRRQMATGQRFPVLWTSLALIVLVPMAVFMLLGRPIAFKHPELGRFNLTGGITMQPELVAMILGLVFYTGGYIAEIVRAGISGVAKGQKEAALALGLSQGLMMRLVVIPQAMRIIIPPLTSQFLNLTKNSSLGIAIAYPDLTHVLANTVLGLTNQSIETIFTLMLVYLTLSLLTSAFMNWFNKRMALVER